MPMKRKPGRPKGSKNRHRPATKPREPRTPPSARTPSRSATSSTPSSRARSPSNTTKRSTPRRAKKPQTPLEVAQAKQLKLASVLAGSAPPVDPYARKLQLPKLPSGKKVGSGMAMDDLGPGAGGTAAFPYQGYFGLNSFALYFPGYPYLAMLAQRTEYIQPTQTHAMDMTREWIEFTTKGKSDKAKKIQEIEERFDELDIQGLFRKAMIHDGFYGGAHIFFDLK